MAPSVPESVTQEGPADEAGGRTARAALNVLVLGMHRSGTSAVAEALRAAGFNAGSDASLMVPEPQNPVGFGELLSVALFNDRLLGSLEWFWDAPDATPLVNPPARAEYVAEGMALIEKDLAGPRPFVIKDPRVSLLLPWWRRILFDRFVPVVVLRDPVEVAWSLRIRDGFPMELGLTLYAAYYRHLAAGLDGLSWIGVDFGALCDRPRPTLNLVLQALSRLGVETEVDVSTAARAIRPLLRRATQPTDGSPAPDLIPALDDIRRQLPADGVAVATRFERIGSPSGWETAILDTYRRAREAGARNDAARENVRELEAQVGTLVAAQAQLESNATHLRGELADAMGDREAAREEHAQLEARLASDVSDRTRLEERLAELMADHGKMEAQVASFASERAELEAELAAARAMQAQLQIAATNYQGELGEALRQLDTARGALGESESQHAALESRNAEQTARLNALVRQNADREREEQELRAQLESHLAMLTAERAELERQLVTAADALRDREGQIAALQARHSQQSARLETLTENNAEQLRMQAQLRAQLAERERDLSAAIIAPRGSSASTSLRSAVRRMRTRYRRLLVHLPPTLVGLVWHNPLFDGAWYLEQNPDIREAHLGPEVHFRRHGAAEGRSPNRLFDTAWYLEHNPDVAASRLNPLDHYLLFGAAEGRSPGPAFDAAWYLGANPDVAASGMNPLLHYLQYGRLEGRSPTSTGRLPIAQSRSARAPLTNERPTGAISTTGVVATGSGDVYPKPPTAHLAASHGRGPELLGTREIAALYDSAEAGQLADDVRLVAFYRSTYYADDAPANGSADGEWLTVAKARATLAGQNLPRVPRDLGFYDLRLAETRRDQADLARRYGINAFCYDQTWGQPDLHIRPFREMLITGEPDFPFTLRMTLERALPRSKGAWRLSAEWLSDNMAQLTFALEALADPRAVRVGNDPLFVVEGLGGDGAPRVAEEIRQQARRVGLPGVFLVGPVATGDAPDSAGALGVDALLEAHPDPALVPRSPRQAQPGLARRVAFAPYDDYARRARAIVSGADRMPSVLVGWDDTPLDGRGQLVLTDATPEAYGHWLRSAVATARDTLARERRLVFVSSWNDWVHGAHLEPDVFNGRAYLEATRACLVAPVLVTTAS